MEIDNTKADTMIPFLYLPLPGHRIEGVLADDVEAVAQGETVIVPSGTIISIIIKDPCYRARWIGTEWQFQHQGNDRWLRATVKSNVWERVEP